jgi:chromosome segregation ATPase
VQQKKRVFMARPLQGKFLFCEDEPAVEEKLRSVASPSRGRRQKSFESQQEVHSPAHDGRHREFESLRQEVRMMVGDSESIDHLTRAVRAEARAEKAELDLLRVQTSLAEKEQRHLDSVKLLDQLKGQNEDLRAELELSRQRVADLRLKEPAVDCSRKLEKQLSEAEALADLWKQRCQDIEKKQSFTSQIADQTVQMQDVQNRLCQMESQAEMWKQRYQEVEKKHMTSQGIASEQEGSNLELKEMIKTLQKQLAQSESKGNLLHSELEKRGSGSGSGCSSARSSAASQSKNELNSLLESELSLARAEVDSLRNRLWQAERELTQGKRQSSNGIVELQRLRSQCSELEENVRVEQNELMSCKSSLQEAQAHSSRMSQELRQCEARLEHAQSRICTDKQELREALEETAPHQGCRNGPHDSLS